MQPLTYALNELEKAQLENIKLKQQLTAAHKEILLINEKNLARDRKELTDNIIKSRKIPVDGFDVLLDDVNGKIVAQPKVLPKETKAPQ